MAKNNNYDLLIEKLDQFTRKYYLNQMIRGGLYSVALLLTLFLGLNFLEHNFYFGMETRKMMFWSFVGISALALAGWMLLPMFRYFRLGQVISHEKAAAIIGEHFGGVKDKLLNVLQLKNQAGNSQNAELILASINQKSEDIKIVPFRKAIDLSQNRKYLRYALPPLALLVILLFAAPKLITDSTARLINNDVESTRPMPFNFVVEDEKMEVIQYEDYPLTVKIEGDVQPNEVFIDVDNYQYRLTKEENGTFTYRFSNVQKKTDFKLFSGIVKSDPYELNVLKKPNILGFDVKLDYPRYTQRKDEELASIGDLVVPAGTNIDWVFNSQNTDNINIKFSNNKDLTETKRFSDELFTLKKKAMKDETYKLFVSNKNLPNADSISYTITVIPDQYPAIKVENFRDSADTKLLFFVGEASDDYGLGSLSFNYRISKDANTQGPLQSVKLSSGGEKSIQYDHVFDVNELALEPGDDVAYYFEVFDNDGVNGAKSARTNIMKYEKPTIEEFEAMAEENNEEIKDKLKNSLEESKKLQEDIKKLREKLLQEKEVDWQTREELEKLMERQEELQKQVEEAKEKFQENKDNQEEFSETDEETEEKQDQLEEIMEDVVDEELEKLMEQIQEMMQELEKEGALENMEEMEENNEEMEMDLERALELFKELEMELEMEKFIEKLEELAEEQEKLAEETEKETDPEKQEENIEKQEELNKKMDELEKDMEELKKKNEELEKKKDLGDEEENQEEIDDIQENMEESKEQMEQKESKSASEKQKNAAGKMKKMAQKMKDSMQQQEQEQLEEDMKTLRQLLENLVGMSFNQEDLISEFGLTQVNTPKYVDLVQKQFKLKDDFRLIEDSLQALAKRNFQIESFVMEKVTDVKSYMKDGLEQLEERRKPQAAADQQRVMKNVNDLALMLSEVMNQMQQQMAGMKEGDQMCDNPGGKGKGKKPSDKISEGQQSLGEQMKEAQDGKKGKDGKPSSKEFAEMAAKQAALRKALEEKKKGMQEKGGGGENGKKLQDLIDGMNQVETDLVNKQLTNQMIKRQEQILSRLLEFEKAEREQEYDNKRKAETAEQYKRDLPPSLEEYIKKREAEIEQYRTVSPALKPYYKNLVEGYFKTLKEK